MKTAICISGQIRCFPEYYENIYKNLIEPNDCDVFFYSDIFNFTELYLTARNNMKEGWDKFDFEKGVSQHCRDEPLINKPLYRDLIVNKPVPREEPFVSFERDAELIENHLRSIIGDKLKKIKLEIEDFKFDDKVMCDEVFKYHPSLKTENEYRDPVKFSRPYVQFQKVKMCNDMKNEYEKEMGSRYDCVIRARTDCLYRRPIVVEKEINNPVTKNIWGKKIHVFGNWEPWGDNYPQINIWEGFAFGSPDVMDVYSDFFLDYGKYFTHTEKSVYGTKLGLERSQRLAMHLHDKNIKIIPVYNNGYRQWPPRCYQNWVDYGTPSREYM